MDLDIQINDLHRAFLREVYPYLSESDVNHLSCLYYQGLNKKELYYIEEGVNIIGFMEVGNPSVGDVLPTFEVRCLYVVPEKRRYGVATQLFKEFLDRQEEKGYPKAKVILSYPNIEAGLFFKSLGFKEDKTNKNSHTMKMLLERENTIKDSINNLRYLYLKELNSLADEELLKERSNQFYDFVKESENISLFTINKYKGVGKGSLSSYPIAIATLTIVEDLPSSTFIGGKVGVINSVYVETISRCEGVGTELIEGIIEHAKVQKVSRLRLYAEEFAIDFYEKLGFTSVDGGNSMYLDL